MLRLLFPESSVHLKISKTGLVFSCGEFLFHSVTIYAGYLIIILCPSEILIFYLSSMLLSANYLSSKGCLSTFLSPKRHLTSLNTI